MSAPPLPPTGTSTHAVAVNAGTISYTPPLQQLYIGGAGTIDIVLQGDTASVKLIGLNAGTVLMNMAIKQVLTATATGLIGFQP